MEIISFHARLSAAVPSDLADTVKAVAAARGITAADYLRGAIQARLLLDDAPFRPLPNLQLVAARGGRTRAA